jgi:glycine dehydrogenase subunit 2
MADYGIDPWWMSHEPWIVAEPFTPEAGELWSKEDIDLWIDVVAKIVEEARRTRRWSSPRRTTSPSRRSRARCLRGPAKWAMTWRAYKRKKAGSQAARGAA